MISDCKLKLKKSPVFMIKNYDLMYPFHWDFNVYVSTTATDYTAISNEKKKQINK